MKISSSLLQQMTICLTITSGTLSCTNSTSEPSAAGNGQDTILQSDAVNEQDSLPVCNPDSAGTTIQKTDSSTDFPYIPDGCPTCGMG